MNTRLILKGIYAYTTMAYWVYTLYILAAMTAKEIVVYMSIGIMLIYIFSKLISLEEFAKITGNKMEDIDEI